MFSEFWHTFFQYFTFLTNCKFSYFELHVHRFHWHILVYFSKVHCHIFASLVGRLLPCHKFTIRIVSDHNISTFFGLTYHNITRTYWHNIHLLQVWFVFYTDAGHAKNFPWGYIWSPCCLLITHIFFSNFIFYFNLFQFLLAFFASSRSGWSYSPQSSSLLYHLPHSPIKIPCWQWN